MAQDTGRQTDPENGNTIQDVTDDQPQSARNQPEPSWPLKGGSNFGDSSGPIFSMYSKITKEEDDQVAERWQKDADGILIFTGLFSAAVAALLAVSVQDLRPSSQDTSAFYLGNIYQVLADPNASPVAQPPPFSPPRYAVWVNSLWSLSLVISLICALLATSLQQWARRFIRLTQPTQCSPEMRARMRASFGGGVDKMHLPLAVGALPFLIHVSLFLFFSGLIIFMRSINHSVYISIVSAIGFFAAVYVSFTCMPFFRPDSPYNTPFSFSAFFVLGPIAYCIIRMACVVRIAFGRDGVSSHYPRNMDMAKKLASIDLDILTRTIGALIDDDTLEKCFEGIPGFFHSQTVSGLKHPLPDVFLEPFSYSWGGFFARTLSSNSVDETVKTRRLEICMKAIKEICDDDGPSRIIRYLHHLRLDPVSPSIRTAEILLPWCENSDSDISELARYIVAKVLPYVRERDDRWIVCARDVFGFPERLLRDHIAHCDNSLLLVILVCAARPRPFRSVSEAWSLIIGTGYNDNMCLGLHNAFCPLWNEIVKEARDREHHHDHVAVLRRIRHLYVVLHQGAASPPTSTVFHISTPSDDLNLYALSSYPLCSISAHIQGHLDPSVPPLSRLDGPNNLSPLLPPSESQPTPGGSTVPQQAIEEIDIAGRPSSAYYSPLRSQQFSSPDPNTVPDEHIVSHANSAALPSIHESIEMVTLDINQRVVAEVSRSSHQSSPGPSSAALTPNIVCSGDPTTDVPPIDEMGQTTPAATSHTLPHPDADPVIVTPSTVPRAPDDGIEQQGIVTPQSMSSTTQNSSMANQISQFIPNIGATLQSGDKPTPS